MEKTRLGLSVTAVGALLYFFGMISFLPSVLLAAFVLVFEDDTWLKRSAVRMIMIVVVFAVISTGVDVLDSFFNIIYNMLNIIFYVNFNALFTFTNSLQKIINILENVTLIVMGVCAFSKYTVRIGFIEKFLDKHMPV